MADSEDSDLKTFLENVLNKTESLICEEHTVITSNLLLHLDLLEKSIELLQLSRENNGLATCQWSQSNDEQAWLDLEAVFSDIYCQFNSYYMNVFAKSMLCTLPCPTVSSNAPGRPRYDIPQEILEELRSLHFTWDKIAKMFRVSR